MKESIGWVSVLEEFGIVDPGVLAAGVERGWVNGARVERYAVERWGGGDDRAVVVELASAGDFEPERLSRLLRDWARLDGLRSQYSQDALRRWMFAALVGVLRGGANFEEMLDGIEGVYAAFGYPEEMRSCSRYYVPLADRLRGIQIGELTDSPLEAVYVLILKLAREFGIEGSVRNRVPDVSR